MALCDAPLDLLAMKGAIKTFLDMADLGVFVVAPVMAPSFRRQEYRHAFGVVERFVAAGLSAADDDKFLIHFKTFLLCWCGVVVSLRSFSRACFLVRLFAPALAPNALSAPRSDGSGIRGCSSDGAQPPNLSRGPRDRPSNAARSPSVLRGLPG